MMVARADQYDLSVLTVLVVDDSEQARRLIADLLTGFGVGRVLESASGDDALDILHRGWIDILICDWRMRPVDGFALVNAVRQAPGMPNPMIPILLVTAYADEPKLVDARDLGVNEILAKPFTPHRLYDKLMAVVESPRAFVRSPSYVGPDRRQGRDPTYHGTERRARSPESSS